MLAKPFEKLSWRLDINYFIKYWWMLPVCSLALREKKYTFVWKDAFLRFSLIDGSEDWGRRGEKGQKALSDRFAVWIGFFSNVGCTQLATKIKQHRQHLSLFWGSRVPFLTIQMTYDFWGSCPRTLKGSSTALLVTGPSFQHIAGDPWALTGTEHWVVIGAHS